ncbi:MAG: hypothetical protein M1826_007590 [Phylliscum demangeonii]|nr:MAG: hypothetical protein M1826_007590 [Phylliscum demangeonii]
MTSSSSFTEEKKAVAAATDDDGMQRFTATGRPKPNEPFYEWTKFQPDTFTPCVVATLPWKFTDEDVISVPVTLPTPAAAAVVPPAVLAHPNEEAKEGFVAKVLLGGKRRAKEKNEKKEKAKVVVLRMTRGDYLKYWARDEQGVYIGTESEEQGWERWKAQLGGMGA